MTAQELKNSILQLAIQGKLVKQDPNDEPASVLLEKIKKEREKLIKEKRIKKEKYSEIYKGLDNRYYEKFDDGTVNDITEEIPFEIPESWKWTRLGVIGNWKSGSTPNKSNREFYDNASIPWLVTGDLNDSYIENTSSFITNIALKKCSLQLNLRGSVLIAMYGATIGKLGILNIDATTNQACCACSLYSDFYNKYLFYYLMFLRKFFKRIAEGRGTAKHFKRKNNKNLNCYTTNTRTTTHCK